MTIGFLTFSGFSESGIFGWFSTVSFFFLGIIELLKFLVFFFFKLLVFRVSDCHTTSKKPQFTDIIQGKAAASFRYALQK